MAPNESLKDYDVLTPKQNSYQFHTYGSRMQRFTHYRTCYPRIKQTHFTLSQIHNRLRLPNMSCSARKCPMPDFRAHCTGTTQFKHFTPKTQKLNNLIPYKHLRSPVAPMEPSITSQTPAQNNKLYISSQN